MKFNAKEILDLLENYCFSEFSESDVSCFLEAIKATENGIDYEYGATKLVLLKDSWDFVVKIPFTGSSEDTDDYDDFYYASNSTAAKIVKGYYDEEDYRCWDYCEAEALLYRAAKILGVDKYFAKTEFIGMAGDHPIYVQEKCEVGPKNSPSWEEQDSFEADSKTKGMYFCGTTAWAIDLYNYIANEELYKIVVNIISRVLFIRDLHSANVGYRDDGCPVLVDYAGYHE